MSKKLQFEIEVDDNGTAKVRKFKRSVEDTERSGKKFGRSMGGLSRKIAGFTLNAGAAALKVGALGAAVVVAAGAFAAWKIKQLASSFIATGSSMDKLKISLDTITKGEGEAWFKKLNEWALKMPINTQKAIESFTMMRAMGLQPTIKDMTTLVDTTSALGGGGDKLLGIARALGQIKTKGKVSAEELMQLAEQGIPAYQILQEKLGLTAKQVANIGNAGISADAAVTALVEGMEERFGGQSEKIQSKWAGLTESMKSYWTEFQRMVMESGVMQWLEENLAAIVAWVDELYSSGKMQEWALDVADVVIELAEDIKELVLDTVGDWDTFERKIEEVFSKLKRWVEEATPMLRTFFKLAQTAAKAIDWVGGNIGKSSLAMDQMAAGSLPGRQTYPSNQSGTGLGGLPNTGLFMGHKGEIVKNPAESEQERRGGSTGGGGFHLTLAPTFMTGDANAARAVAQDIKRELDMLNLRLGTT